jgi:hypothetical protein
LGNPSQSPPHPGTDASPSKDSYLGIPLKGWAGFAISLIAVCATVAHYAIGIWADYKEQKNKADTVIAANKTLTSENKVSTPVYNDATSRTNLITKEMEKHATDKTGQRVIVHHDASGDTVATYFASDGCIALARPGPTLPYLEHAGDVVRWFLGPSVQAASTLYDADVGESANKATAVQFPRDPATPAGTFTRSISGANSRPRLRTVRAEVPKDCVNPHPGNFNSKWGPANGCVAALTRTWADGCSHYQNYNSCTGKWDPEIHWTVCNADQHH